MVGCNEDAWRTTSKIWFERALKANEFGAAFTGSRQIGNGKTAPQSGMNEVGLTFSRLSAHYPKKGSIPGRLAISNEYDYLTQALHKCKTVEEVKRYIEQYDHSVFIDDVFIYIDSSGTYLVVEPYELSIGTDATYVLANFCPSITNSADARRMARFRNGEDFLRQHKPNVSLAFCANLADTMHVCRNRNGDGTLLTSIWDTQKGLVNLYFYHQFDTTIQFNLKDELAKGNHSFDIPSLFPTNAEFQRLANYKTPFNTPAIRISLVLLGGMLTLFALVFGIYQLQRKKSVVLFLFSGVNLLLTSYLFVLATNSYIFYFDAPFQHYTSKLISLSSYTPFTLLLFALLLVAPVIRLFKDQMLKPWIKGLIMCNYLVYLISLMGFTYWGLFQVFH